MKSNGESPGSGMYKPTGELQGDDKPMPDKGVKSGVTDTYGADLSGDATNRLGSMRGGAKSDKDGFA